MLRSYLVLHVTSAKSGVGHGYAAEGAANEKGSQERKGERLDEWEEVDRPGVSGANRGVASEIS